MARHILKFTFSLILLAVIVFTACERDPDPRPSFSRADSYSPSVAATDDTVFITGDKMVGSQVRLNGELVEIEIEEEHRIGFIVEDHMESGSITIQLPEAGGIEGDRKTFNNDIYINEEVQAGTSWDGLFTNGQSFASGDIMRGPKTMLISDFDGSGIRRASSTTSFSNVFWETNAAAAANVGIGKKNVPSSPAGGNYLYGTILGSGILDDTYGFVMESATRSETMNDAITPWPDNFVEYPGSIIPEDFEMDQLYLNFYTNNNGYSQTNVRIWLYNDAQIQEDRFVQDVQLIDSEEKWEWQSIPIREFRPDFGNAADRVTKETFMEVNKIQFQLADLEGMDNAWTQNDVQGYIDHIVISYGGPMPEPVQR